MRELSNWDKWGEVGQAVRGVQPSRVEGVNQQIHQLALVAMGMPLIDNADLEALSGAAALRRRERVRESS